MNVLFSASYRYTVFIGMKYSLIFFVFAFFIPMFGRAQVWPLEGSSLHYRLIGFSVPVVSRVREYRLEVAPGYYNSVDSFTKNVIKIQRSKSCKMVAEVPAFGADYTWRVIGNNVSKNVLHHFRTSFSENVDTTHLRLKVLTQALNYKGAYVFLDGNKVLYDMKGNAVWYLPERTLEATGWDVTDLKLTSAGTITFLAAQKGFEINYNGDVLWQTPPNRMDSQSIQRYCHHEFTRLANGHYMVLGSEFRKVSVAGGNEGGRNNTQMRNTPFGTVIEYDKDGKIVWTWKSSEYFEKSDLIYYAGDKGDGMVNIHENAFFFDEPDSIIYISFKNISRIVKVKYPQGTILNAYGEIYKKGMPPKGNDLFCQQHACKRSQIGCLFLFNNNGCNPGNAPKVKMLQEPAGDAMPLKKIWEYDCIIDNSYPQTAPSGGNVIEMPDKSLFVSMAGVYSKIFLVNLRKELQWSALPEIWMENEKKWTALGQYRASIISDGAKMEQLIWQRKLEK